MTDSRTLTVLRKLIVDTVNADPHLSFGHLDDEVAERIAVAVLAQFHPLPTIRPGHDDLLYWERLNDRDLSGSVFVDAWNLAAGLHVQRERTQAQGERLASDVAAFSYREVAS